jgi:hypothetical protein
MIPLIRNNIRKFNSIISVLIIITLQLDYFITKKFWMEGIFDMGLSLLLFINIIRQSSIEIYSIKPLAYIVNGLIIITGIYCFSMLMLMFWGYGFTGETIPLIWMSAIVLNILLGIGVMIELTRIPKND